MSATRALQKAIKVKIDAASVGATVYDGPPPATAFPRIVFSDSQILPNNADDKTSQVEIVQIDVFSRDQGELHPCKAIVQAVYDALHEQRLTMDDPYAEQTMDVLQARVFKEPDQKTAHGVIQLQVAVQTVA